MYCIELQTIVTNNKIKIIKLIPDLLDQAYGITHTKVILEKVVQINLKELSIIL